MLYAFFWVIPRRVPLPCHTPSYWLRLFSSQTFSPISTPTLLKPSHSSHLHAYEDGTECSETLAYKIQTPGNYPEESIQQPKRLKNDILINNFQHSRSICFYVKPLFHKTIHSHYQRSMSSFSVDSYHRLF